MFATLLVPLDGSPLAEAALPYAEALARRGDGRLALVRAVDGDEAEAEDYLRAVAARLEAGGLTVNAATVPGDAAEVIAADADARNADLIVLASHGRDGLARLFVGSVAEEVVQRTARPVMVVPAEAAAPAAPFAAGSRVLVPLDGTAASERALPVARELARSLGGELALLSVIAPPPPAMTELSVAATTYADFDLEGARRESQEYLDRTARAHGLDPAAAEAVIWTGDAADGIAEAIRERDAAVVVMATEARSGLGRLLFGSTAADTLAQIAVPLVLLHVGDDAELAGSEQAVGTTDPRAATAVNIA